MTVTRPRAALFDLDGTLVDSLPGITAGINVALGPYLPAPVGETEMRRLIGAPLERIFATLIASRGLDAGTIPPIANLVQAYLAVGASVVAAGSPLFPQMQDLLERCVQARIHLAIVTTKRTPIARSVLEATGIDRYFSAVIGADATPRPKPYPDPALAALSALEVPAGEAVGIGDSDFDVLMARSAGCRSVGVAWGYGGAPALREAGAEAIAHSVDELAVLLGLS